MKLNAKLGYVCAALLELGLNWSRKEPVQVQAIARNQRIPIRYLVQILIHLKTLGFVTSERGKQGGYRLNKAPSQIILGDVIREVQGPLVHISGLKSGKSAKVDVFNQIWDEVDEAISKVVDKITLEDMCMRSKNLERTILYEI